MKKLILISSIVILIIICLVIFSLGQKSQLNPFPSSLPTPTPISAPNSIINSSVHLVSISPKDKEENVLSNASIKANFSQPVPGITFNIYPSIESVPTVTNNQIIIAFSQPLDINTIYTYSFLDQDGNIIFTGTFATGNSSNSVAPLSQEYDHLQTTADSEQRKNYPDVYLATYTPYDSDSFSVTSDFSDSEGGSFFFTVTQKAASGKGDFLSWLHSLSLTDEEIQKLDIRYQ